MKHVTTNWRQGLALSAALAVWGCGDDDGGASGGSGTGGSGTGATMGSGTGATMGSGTGATMGSGTGTTMGSGTGTTTGSTTGPECMGDAECGGGTPYCEMGRCVSCEEAGGSAYCGEKAGVAGDVCDPAGGACVECLPGEASACTGDEPVCDGETKSCRGCEWSSECGVYGCAWWEGGCLDGGLLYVDGGDVSCNDNGAGTESEPLCTVSAGVTQVSDGGTVVVKAKGTAYQENVAVVSGKRVALLGVGMPKLLGPGQPALEVLTGGVLSVEGVEVSGGNGDGVSCNGASLYVSGSVVKGHPNGRGVLALNCDVGLRGVVVSANGQGGVDVGSGSTVRMENVYVVGNGNGISTTGGIFVSLNASLELTYGTVVRNDGPTFDALGCAMPQSVTVRNSLLYGQQGAMTSSVDTANCGVGSFEGNASETDLGAGNTQTGGAELGWFVDPGGGDYHLSASGASVFEDVATWKAGDPVVDYDGDARPGVDGAKDYAGADVPQ